jgi:hypothetical protein
MTEGTALTNYDAAYAEAAAKFAEAEKANYSSELITTRGGVLQLGEEQLPGNQMCVIILDSVRENTFYAGKFDPNAPAGTVRPPPICYAFGEADDEMAPHQSMAKHPEYFDPQHSECTGCPMNEWGSADTGKGKACQNRRRLALIPAGMFLPKKGSRDFDLDLFDEEKHFATSDMLFMKLPPTSVSEYGKYVQQVSATHRRPPFGVITRVYLEPHPAHQYHVKFEMLELLPDALANTVFGRHNEAHANIITPYSPPQEREAPAPAKGGIRGVRR